MDKLLLNADEASYVLGISKSTLLRLTKVKKIASRGFLKTSPKENQ